MDDKTIDLEQIMAQIAAQAATLPKEILCFSPMAALPEEKSMSSKQIKSLQENLQKARGLQNVLSERPVMGKGFFAVCARFIKKIVRKFTRFYIVPIVNDQNNFNASSVHCLQDITDQLQTVQQSMEQLGISNPKEGRYQRAQLENFVYETLMQKLTALELQTEKLLCTNATLEAEATQNKKQLLEQAQALTLLQHQCAVLEKKAELAGLTKLPKA